MPGQRPRRPRRRIRGGVITIAAIAMESFNQSDPEPSPSPGVVGPRKIPALKH
jgi:hypothetical protein